MSDRDNITLPREVVEKIHEAWSSEVYPPATSTEWYDIMDALRTALAAEQPKPEPVAWVQKWAIDRLTGQMGAVSDPVTWGIDAPLFTCEVHHSVPLYTAPPSTHPGYIIGSHWLETAYSRICAGEAEADVLRDIGLVREEAFLTGVAHLKAENEALRRDAERYRYLRNRDPEEVFGKSGKAAGVWIDWENDMAGLQLLTGDDADAAIDAAMGVSDDRPK